MLAGLPREDATENEAFGFGESLGTWNTLQSREGMVVTMPAKQIQR